MNPQTHPGPALIRSQVEKAVTGPGHPKRQTQQKHTRGATNQTEEARRKEWGRKWGNVGREWKQANNPRGN